MSHAPKPPIPDVRVTDPAAAMQRAMDFARKVLSVRKTAAKGEVKPTATERRERP